MTKHLLLLFLCIAGCTTGSHRVVNHGDKLLSAVSVQSGDRRFGHGYLPPNAHASYEGSMVIKRESNPVVTWQVDGANDMQIVPVEMPKGLVMGRTVVFEIKGDQVSVHYE